MLKGILFVFVVFAASGSAAAAPLRLLSQRDVSQLPPAGGSGDSGLAILSSNSRYVLFASSANNLVLNVSSNGLPAVAGLPLNVFLRDRSNATTVLVSPNQAGTGGGNRDSVPAGLSSDARYALFESTASNLAPTATNGYTQVFVRDLASDVTMLVSASTNGGAANGACRDSVLTPDGRYICFVSEANNLVPFDTNGIADVFVRDLQNQTTTLVSAGARATNSPPLAGSEAPEISDDGRYVAFYSAATNLVPGATRGGEIYLRDVVGATTYWVSAAAHSFLGAQYGLSFNHALSADGKFVAYEACGNGSASGLGYPRALVLRFNLDTTQTDLIYSNAYAPVMAADEVAALDMTPDGRFVAFLANTNNNTATFVLLWDAQSGTSTLVSGDSSNNIPSSSICTWPMIDASGRYVAFLSSARNIVTNSVTGEFHLYVRDGQTGTTKLMYADPNGIGVAFTSAARPRLSTNGTVMVFDSAEASLVSGDRNHRGDVFLADFSVTTNELISVREPSLSTASANGPSRISVQNTSANGRWLVFASEADDLIPGDTNGFRDIFAHDLRFGTNLLVSVALNGLADGDSTEAAISGDGRYVAFTSWADNLVPMDTNRNSDVFISDLVAGTILLVSTNTGGTGPGNNASYAPVLSADGRFVLFRSKASNIASGTFSGAENLFLRDVQIGTNFALTTSGLSSVSMTPDGRWIAFTDVAGAGNIYVWDSQTNTRVETNSTMPGVTNISISPNGSKIACFAGPGSLFVVDRIARTNGPIAALYPVSRPGMRFSADSRFMTYAAAASSAGTNQVYVCDFQAGANLMVSSAGAGLDGSANSDSPDISADGRFIAYRTSATNLLPGVSVDVLPNLVLYDRLTASTTLLSANYLNGMPGDNRSLVPFFTPDGRALLFQSWASDLVPSDFNHSDDIFALAFLYASIVPGLLPGEGPTISWPVRPGEQYQVEFKNSLDDPAWQQIVGSIIFEGNQARVTDLAPATGARFYRVKTL